MISTFDLILLGSLISAGGLVFLQQAKRPHFEKIWLSGRQAPHAGSTRESRERLERSTALAGTRWLTVGALTLFLAYAQGAAEGYLMGPWSDLLFHLVFVAGCWGMTAWGIKRKAEAPAGQTNDCPSSTSSPFGTEFSRPGD
ncbi:MAG TPA: hypothetical protein VLA99_03045 [Nitrospiraceae bacterium]|nr:hypothetical protein [Nitrospiraceae bacterium]